MEHVVLAAGGSIVAPADPAFIAQLADKLEQLSRHRRMMVVVGGGKTARDAIAVGRQAGAQEEMLDRIGIQATRLNAQVLIGFLQEADVDVNVDVPLTTHDAATLDHAVVVMGGTTPGHSTDYVGAELAHVTHAKRLLIATNVDGVYDADPRDNPGARRIERMDFEELVRTVGGEWKQAGQAGVVDGPAAILLCRHRIETRVVDGTDLDNLVLAADGNGFHGTLIAEDA